VATVLLAFTNQMEDSTINLHESARPLSERLYVSAKNNAQKVAVEDSGGRWILTYNQLLHKADIFLQTISQVTNRPVVLNMTKSAAYFGAVASCFINRISFCPVDLVNPIERVWEIASQFPSCIVVTDENERHATLKMRGVDSILIDSDGFKLESNIREKSSSSRANERRPCYYIATSGSTGKPKLVKVPHQNTTDFVDWAVAFYDVNNETRWAQFSSIGFDLSLVDILTVLIGGGTLIALSSKLDRIRPARIIHNSRITHWHSVPSVIPYLLAEGKSIQQQSPVRLFTFCGEPLAKVDVVRLREQYPSSRIINTYGPTEGTLFCSFFECKDFDSGHTTETVSIGEPIPGWYFVYLDELDVSRLIILSNNIADGYVGEDSPNFASIDIFGTPIRAFDTGDYFSRIDSLVYFSHRRDRMVKISGNRVDLGEVEAAAKQVGIINPVALFESGTLIVVGEGEPQSVADRREALSRLLPPYSVPATILFSRVHPRTPNGKIDRSAIRKEWFPM
jgi:D-alanine--poly(phosphoribitol) ligase subunit 1